MDSDFMFPDTKAGRSLSPSWWAMCRWPGNSNTLIIAGRLAATDPLLCSFSAACQTDWSSLHPTPRDPADPRRGGGGGSAIDGCINKPELISVNCQCDLAGHMEWCRKGCLVIIICFILAFQGKQRRQDTECIIQQPIYITIITGTNRDNSY